MGTWHRFAKPAIACIALLVGGGALAGPEYPFTTATQAEYAAGDTAVVLGYDFQPGQELIVRITRPDGSVVNSRGRKNQADTVVVDSWGQFGYEYPQLDTAGFYYVDIIDPATVTKGKDKSSGTVLASTVFKDNITTDLELVGMPLAQCGANRPPAHGSSPPTPSHGHDGLVDALAGRCLVGTVDIRNTDSGASIQGFQFHLDPALLSNLQGGGGMRPFIDRLETVDIVQGTPDADTGNAPADDGQGGCASDCYYTTAGNTNIPKAGVFNLTSQDGTQFSVEYQGTVPKGPTLEERYLVTVLSDVPGARFEYCARINPDAGDADLGNDGWIDSSPLTGGEETSPINICRLADQSPPICEVTFIDTPCQGIEVFVSDPESGVESITVVEVRNATVTITPTPDPGMPDGTYSPPETGDIFVDACKDDLSLSSFLELEIVNGEGLITVCDPVDFTLLRADGPPARHQFPLNDREGFLRIDNSGVQDIFMDLNGKKLRFTVHNLGGPGVYTMPGSGVVNYDLREYLVPGDNSVEIRATGAPGGHARVSIHD